MYVYIDGSDVEEMKQHEGDECLFQNSSDARERQAKKAKEESEQRNKEKDEEHYSSAPHPVIGPRTACIRVCIEPA
jgi:hypothetical protein